MFGLEKKFVRPTAVDEKVMDKPAAELAVAIKDLSLEEKGFLKQVLEDINEFLKKDYEASL